MPLFKNDKNDYVLYIHIPKSGGTSIKSLIMGSTDIIGTSPSKKYLPTSPQHFHAVLMKQVGYTDIANTSFAIIRDPLNRLLSEYKYRRKNSKVINYCAILKRN